jgi:hypothetical protein
MNLFLRNLGSNVSNCNRFKLHIPIFTLEKLENFFNLVKSICKHSYGTFIVIQGWFNILSKVIRFYAGTKIFLIRSRKWRLSFFAAGT